jgi:hypothetical protein
MRVLRHEPPPGGLSYFMKKTLLTFLIVLATACASSAASLPFGTVFKGVDRFNALAARADAGDWKNLPIGERTATVGRALVGTPYKHYTLEIDDRIEAPSVNFLGMDCWTFFEISLGFARMLDEPREQWTPQTLLHYIELDRYRGGKCTGEYLSRLHYLEDWLRDNESRGLMRDITRGLGGSRMPHIAREMTVGWRGYRYLVANPSLMPALQRMEARVTAMRVYYIPKSKVARIEPLLRNGDIICIVAHDGNLLGTAHVGLALRDSAGVLRFMHASSPTNYNHVVIDTELSKYLYRYTADAGIIVARPVK